MTRIEFKSLYGEYRTMRRDMRADRIPLPCGMQDHHGERDEAILESWLDDHPSVKEAVRLEADPLADRWEYGFGGDSKLGILLYSKFLNTHNQGT